MRIMRKNVIKAASAALLLTSVLAFNCSCSKEGTPQSVYTVDFYLGVNPDNAACIYKNNELLYTLDSNSWISGLAVMSDGSIYACGEITSPSDETSSPAIWKDGKRLDTDWGNVTYCSLSNMITVDNSWLCCGTLNDENGRYGVIVKDGKVVYRSGRDISFQAMDFGISGDWYVVGREGNELKLFRVAANSWELKSTETVVTDEEGYSWDASCIHVGANDIAIGLDKRNNSTFVSVAYCWLNNGRGLSNIENSSSISDITFFGGYLVIGGCHEIVTSGDGYVNLDTSAIQWVNGMPSDFSYGCTGSSQVALLKNWNEVFLFQAVEHEGGIQLCNNGALFESVRFDKRPYLSCWDVVISESKEK